MQQVLIHIIPIFFAIYAFNSLFGKTRLHWVVKILMCSLMLIASQYPGLARSFLAIMIKVFLIWEYYCFAGYLQRNC